MHRRPRLNCALCRAYTLDHFQIDFAGKVVTCPQGHSSQYWYERLGSRGKPAIQAMFASKVCQACPARQRCTTSPQGRQLIFIPEPEFSALRAARQREKTIASQSMV
jgi:hypothetical protein